MASSPLRDRHNENVAIAIDKINRSLEAYSAKILGDRHGRLIDDADTAAPLHLVDVEFPNLTQACQWASDWGMLKDVIIERPKASMNAPCTVTFTLMAFTLAVLSR